MNITLRQLRVFDAVARHLSFTRAGEELFLTQPAVSMQIKQLESVTGLALFETVGQRVDLTAPGREVLHYARAILRELAEAEQVIGELKGVRRGQLSLTVVTTVNYFAPRLLAAFCKQFPDVRVSLDVTNRESVLRQLASNQTDIVLMGQPPENANLDATAFMDNPLVVIAPPGHPLTRELDIPLAQLLEQAFLVREPGSGTRDAMERFFAARGAQPAVAAEMNSNEAIKQSVQAGLGLGIVSRHTLELELEAGRLVVLDVKEFPILRKWFVVHRAAKRLSPMAAAFKGFVIENAARLAPSPLSR